MAPSGGAQFVALLLALASQNAVPQGASAQVGTGSCVGVDACLNGPALVGSNSCLGKEACFEGPDSVGDNTCVGGVAVCDSAELECLDGSFVVKNPYDNCSFCPCPLPGEELEPCPVVSPDPAYLTRSCYQAGGPGAVFGDDSCNTSRGSNPGEAGACRLKVGDVGSRSCNGASACFARLGNVGDDACVGVRACTGFVGSSGDVATGSCNGEGACENAGSIGAGSCNGSSACGPVFSVGARVASVGAGSCNGDRACEGTANVGNNSCNGDDACRLATEAIGDCEMNTVFVAACAQSVPSLRPLGLTSVAVLLLAAGLYATRARRK